MATPPDGPAERPGCSRFVGPGIGPARDSPREPSDGGEHALDLVARASDLRDRPEELEAVRQFLPAELAAV
jgi:hypothetical protein